MTMVRCILLETTRPVRIRPRMETRPVKGHFLSDMVLANLSANRAIHMANLIFEILGMRKATSARNIMTCGLFIFSFMISFSYFLFHLVVFPQMSLLIPSPRHAPNPVKKLPGAIKKIQHRCRIPMKLPSMAALGVRNPRPTSLYHLRPWPTFLLLALVFELRKM